MKEKIVTYGNFRVLKRLCEECDNWFVFGCGGGEYLECPEC